jgi:hypothetical protein
MSKNERCGCGYGKLLLRDCIDTKNYIFGYCPQCKSCLGRYFLDPCTDEWGVVPPHADISSRYYCSVIWDDYYCPQCGRVKNRIWANERKFGN